uniref:NAD(P)H-quinone oxidoreductase subunit 2, chloroplastic n=1 Tax=Chaetosphaeridium globosum TaxID=96477 RepID=NU2C_CHAGL|nr:NADH dehydrogenase subunit 2 [Chaetosphaeridium globosum]Q8MA16.1 RecName: Full=NAD(P)H-quinone oxidoreductase subunit 2, chloroplastic; AltName: Full=NAD(P)H dehydrogenase, subunit 2; AltName: Full=NADH-plastoquinone oxidoreductase subunit 2 [Chaetosphaeridium globosum]AAM96515.1 subunit 2 of NADH-plastoquinone oxidoreductase [Chaetosphaeridium globosum]
MEIQNNLYGIDLYTILPESILIFCLLTTLIIDLSLDSKNKSWIIYLNTIGLILSGLFLCLQWNGIIPVTPFPSFKGDSFSIAFRFCIIIASLLSLLLSIDYIKRAGVQLMEFVIFLLGATIGGMFLCGANDLITIFTSLECLGLSSYLLAGYSKQDIRSNEAAMKYLLVGGASSAILAYGFSWLYGLSGGKIILSEIVDGLIFADFVNPLIKWITLTCIIVGLGFKISAVPFHQWTPDVYEGSPTPVVAFLSVASKTAGLALTIRIIATIFPYLENEWQFLLQILACLTMIVGNLVAITQTSMKRMLAYSSISQAGYLMIGIISSTNDGYASSLVYMLIYIFMNLGAFGCVILFGLRTGTDQIRDFSGLYLKDPWLASCLTIFLLSLGGIPPFAGFFGKIYLFWSGWQAGLYILTFVGLLTSVISIYYYLRIIKIMFVREAKEFSSYVKNYVIPVNSLLPQSSVETAMIVCMIASSVMGIAINPIIQVAQKTILSTIPFI